MKHSTRMLTNEQRNKFINLLKDRFETNQVRHPEMSWAPIQVKLEASPDQLWSLDQMEQTGGEPDVIIFDETTGEYVFFDCSAESPKDRRSLCYDQAAIDSRRENKPVHSALGLAAEMGVEVLTENQYRELQKHGEFDTKTSSWVKAPDSIRNLGGALFCDRRYNHVFVYHNGAESYYASRGFRALLRV